jgi:pSer/pThr/pTyr-binding forkhead associated (FHA) protein
MAVFIVGRAPSEPGTPIRVEDKTVSRNHCRLTEIGDGFRLEDLNSTSGTFVSHQGNWKRVLSANVRLKTDIKLGNFATTIGDLLHRAGVTIVPSTSPKPPSKPQGQTVPARFERNPDTGEIVRRKS